MKTFLQVIFQVIFGVIIFIICYFSAMSILEQTGIEVGKLMTGTFSPLWQVVAIGFIGGTTSLAISNAAYKLLRNRKTNA